MSRQERRSFSREYKLAVIGRLEAGESGSALALELGIKRTIIYRWRGKWRAGGELALRSQRGRPTKADAMALEVARGPASKASDLAEARRRIAELERKVGQQQLQAPRQGVLRPPFSQPQRGRVHLAGRSHHHNEPDRRVLRHLQAGDARHLSALRLAAPASLPERI